MDMVYSFIYKYLYSENYILFLFKSCLFFFALSLISNILIEDILNIEINKNTTISTLEKYPILVYYLFGGLLMPVFETIIFQWLPIFIFSLIKVNREKGQHDYFFAFIVSLIFGLFHNYSLGYILSSVVVGFFYIVFGLSLERNKNNYFLPILIVHSFNNMISLSLAVYFK